MLVIGLKPDKEKSLKLTCEEELCSEYKNKHVIFLLLYCEAENILWSPGIWLTFYCSWHSGVVFLLSGLETILYHSLYLEQQFLKRGWWILFDLTVQCTYRVPFTERFHMHLLHMTHMSFKCIHPLYISRGFSGQWVNRFVLSCLAMALIGGPFPKLSSILPNSSSCKSSSIWKSLISHLYRHWHQQSWQLFSSITDPELQSRASLPHYKFCVILLWYWLQDLSLKGEPFPELRVQPLIFGTDWLAVHRDQRRVQERRHWWSFPVPKLRGQPLNSGKRPLP